MTLVPRREYLALLAGDICVFVLSLYATLALRMLSLPSWKLFSLHFVPFSILFVIWIGVFFLAGLYGRHTRLFRSKLLSTILFAHTLNIVLAALFFFSFVSLFVITPKTVLLIYLVLSACGIFVWRMVLFPRFRTSRRIRGVLIASGPDAAALAEEVAADVRYPFEFKHVIDTGVAQSHEVIQNACRVAEEEDLAFLVADFSDPSLSAALPIIYDAAFQKPRFALVDVTDLYEEVFQRAPLSFMRYEWVLANLSRPARYDLLKRGIDILLSSLALIVALPFLPLVALAIKMDDGGPVFIIQERVGRYQKPIRILKLRSMTGNDQGRYGASGVSDLTVTRVGAFLRLLRIDEVPQLWNILRGDLSFVGPRPELPSLATHYSARIPYYNARYLIAPGLTGWAQIKHDRHPHHGTEVLETKEKLSYDLYYFERRSLLLDLYIILQTARIVITAKGS